MIAAGPPGLEHAAGLYARELLVVAAGSAAVLLVIRAVTRGSAPAGPVIVRSSPAGPVLLGAAVIAAAVIWAKSRKHPAVPRPVTRVVIRHVTRVVSHPVMTGGEVLALGITALVVVMVLGLNHAWGSR